MQKGPTAEQLYYSPEAAGRFTEHEEALRRHQLELIGNFKLPTVADSSDFISRHGQEVIAGPLFGAWLDRVIQVMTLPTSEEVHAERIRRIYHIGNYALATALLTGQEKELLIPPYGGYIVVPEMGRIAVTGMDEQFVSVMAADGGITIDEPGNTIHIPRGAMTEPTEHWQPLRYIGPPDFTIPLNDIDPNRNVFRYPVADRLTEAEHAHWHTVFSQAWEFIQQHDPYTAAIVRASLAAIVPAPQEPLTHGKSMAAGAAYGVIGINECRDPERLASHLIFGTRKHMAMSLKGVTAALAFTEGDPFTTMPVYAPSHEGRAVAPHLLEDGFLNTGLARYFAHVADNAEVGLQAYARLSFARWFVESQQSLQKLELSGYQKAENAQITAALQQELAALAGHYDTVPEPIKRMVATNLVGHYASWRLHNSTPMAGSVQYLKSVWLRGDQCPAIAVPAELSPSTDAYTHIGQRTRYILQETRLKEPAHFAAVQRGQIDQSRFGNPTPGDIAFASGDIRGARNYFAATIQNNPHNKEAWAGFALTYEHDRSAAAGLLSAAPELAAALYAAIGDSRLSPEDVAAWAANCRVVTAIDT